MCQNIINKVNKLEKINKKQNGYKTVNEEEIANKVYKKMIKDLKIPKKYLNIKLKDLDLSDCNTSSKEIKEVIGSIYQEINFNNLKDNSLYIYADDKGENIGTGTGKTLLAYRLYDILISKYSSYISNKKKEFALKDMSLTKNKFRKILSCEIFNKIIAYKSDFKSSCIEELKNKMKYPEVLLWDDFLSEQRNEYILAQILEIIDYRKENGKVTIFTSNYNLNYLISNSHKKENINKQCQRIYSRIKESCLVPKDVNIDKSHFILEIDGKDKRIE